MDPITSCALFDELSKIAVSIDELQQLARRVPTIRLKTRGLAAGAASGVGDLRQAFGSAGLATVPKPSQVKAFVRSARNALPAEMMQDPEVAESLRRSLAASLQMSRQAGGTILAPAGGLTGQLRNLAKQEMVPAPPTSMLSPAGKKALNLVGVGHEAAELRTPAPLIHGFSSHLSPDVLLREHNMLATLSGPGAQEAQQYMQQLRQGSGEAGAINSLLKNQFGERAAVSYGQGAKIPKAMRKRLGQWAHGGGIERAAAARELI